MIKTSVLKFLDASAGPVLCSLLGWINLLLKGGERPGSADPAATRRILLIRPGGMGDMLMLGPVIRRILEMCPQAVIDMVCEKRNAEMAALIGPGINVLLYDAHPLRVLLHIRRSIYDLAIDTEQFHHFSAIFALISGAPVRTGFKINPRRNALYTHLINYAPDGYEGHQFMNLLKPLGNTDDKYELKGFLRGFSTELPAEIGDILAEAGRKGRIVAIHPGGSVRHKQWPIASYSALAEQLIRDNNVSIVLLGSARDRKNASLIENKLLSAGHKAVCLAGQLSLSRSVGVLQRSSLVIGPDSGLIHLAVALDIPSIALFGPSDHEKWSLPSTRHSVIYKGLPCSPCFIFGYHKPCRSADCMKEISVEMTVREAKRILG